VERNRECNGVKPCTEGRPMEKRAPHVDRAEINFGLLATSMIHGGRMMVIENSVR